MSTDLSCVEQVPTQDREKKIQYGLNEIITSKPNTPNFIRSLAIRAWQGNIKIERFLRKQ